MAPQNVSRPGTYPFKPTHIGVVTRDLDKTITRYQALGAGPFKRFRLPDPEFTFKRRWSYDVDASDHVYDVAYGQMANGFGVEIFQLISCDNPDKNIAQQYLDQKGECVWHLGHDVEDMDAALVWMKEAGYEVIGGAEYEDGTLMCYFSTQDLGYIIQLHQVVAGSVADRLTSAESKKES